MGDITLFSDPNVLQDFKSSRATWRWTHLYNSVG